MATIHIRRAPLDYTAYPHILESVLHFAPRATLLSLRGVSKTLRLRADKLLTNGHLVLSSPGGQPCINTSDGRLPAFMPDSLTATVEGYTAAERWSLAASTTEAVTLLGGFPPNILRTSATLKRWPRLAPHTLQLFTRMSRFPPLPPFIDPRRIHTLVAAVPGKESGNHACVLVVPKQLRGLKRLVLHAVCTPYGVTLPYPDLQQLRHDPRPWALEEIVLVLHPPVEPDPRGYAQLEDAGAETIAHAVAGTLEWYPCTHAELRGGWREAEVADDRAVRYTFVGAQEVYDLFAAEEGDVTGVVRGVLEELMILMGMEEVSDVIPPLIRIVSMAEFKEERGEQWEREMDVPGCVGMPWDEVSL